MEVAIWILSIYAIVASLFSIGLQIWMSRRRR